MDGFSQLILWPVWQTCSAMALEKVSSFLTALWCSFKRCVRFLPVCPMYVALHSWQDISYTTPDFDKVGILFFGFNSILLRVFSGLKTVCMPRGDSILLMASDWPCMYGIVTLVVVSSLKILEIDRGGLYFLHFIWFWHLLMKFLGCLFLFRPS